MKVYVIIERDPPQPYGVYDTREAAEKVIKQEQLDAYIMEFTVGTVDTPSEVGEVG